MAEASRRVARSSTPDAGPNAWFVACGVELLPTELTRIADLVTVRFPWGSLLRGALGVDRDVAGTIARLVARGGRLEITLSLVGRDRGDPHGDAFGAADLARMTAAFGALGMACVEARELPRSEVLTQPSSWARRLRAGDPRTERPVWWVAFDRARLHPQRVCNGRSVGAHPGEPLTVENVARRGALR